MCRCCTFDLYSSVGSEIEFDLNDIKERERIIFLELPHSNTTYNQKVKYLRETYLQVLQKLWFESYVSVCYWMRGWKKRTPMWFCSKSSHLGYWPLRNTTPSCKFFSIVKRSSHVCYFRSIPMSHISIETRGVLECSWHRHKSTRLPCIQTNSLKQSPVFERWFRNRVWFT